MNHPLYKYPLRQLAVGEVLMLKDWPNLANYISKRGRALQRVFRTKRVGNERRVTRVA